jgi:hypothetical protein
MTISEMEELSHNIEHLPNPVNTLISVSPTTTINNMQLHDRAEQQGDRDLVPVSESSTPDLRTYGAAIIQPLRQLWPLQLNSTARQYSVKYVISLCVIKKYRD